MYYCYTRPDARGAPAAEALDLIVVVAILVYVVQVIVMVIVIVIIVTIPDEAMSYELLDFFGGVEDLQPYSVCWLVDQQRAPNTILVDA